MAVLFHLERFCCALATLFPRVAVSMIMLWGLWVHIFVICIPRFSTAPLIEWSFIVSALTLYILASWAYFETVAVGPGSPLELEGFRASLDDLEAGVAGPPPAVFNNVTAKDNGEMRFCSKCECWKPDRTHHCRVCKRCVLRMDHHCPWFSCCIGFYNHKFFVQFLVYVTFFCLVCAFSSLLDLAQFFAEEQYKAVYLSLNVVLLMIASGVMGIAVAIFAGFTVYQVLTNTTTIESLEGSRYKTAIPSGRYRYAEAPSNKTVGNLFNLGWRRNWRMVMGFRVYEWVLPVKNASLDDGTSFPINEELWAQVQRKADAELEQIEHQRRYVLSERDRMREVIPMTEFSVN